MANTEKSFESLGASELAALTNPIAKKYYIFFKCLEVPQDQYKKDLIKLIEYAREACTSESEFCKTIEVELIELLRTRIDTTPDRDKTLESFLRCIDAKHKTLPIKAIKEFDILIHSLYDQPDEQQDIISNMMRKDSTLSRIMERICEEYTEKKEGQLIIKIGDPIIIEYIDLYNELVGNKSEKTTNEINDFIMGNLNEPSFTENQMFDIGRRVLHGDCEAQMDLAKSECKLVKQLVDKYKDCSSDYQKLLTEGYNALISSSRSFDYTKGVKFKTYATFNIEKRIFKAIIDEWEKEKHYDKKWNEIRALEQRMSRAKNSSFTGRIIEEEMNISDGDIVLKVYFLRKKYEEMKDSDLMSNEYENNGEVKDTDDISKLINKLRDLVRVSEEEFKLFADVRGLKDGLIKSSSSVASCFGIDANKVRSYRLAVEGAINKDIASRRLFDTIMSKRQQIVDSVKNKLQPIIDKTQKRITITPGIDTSDSDKELIALFESKTSITDIAIYFQIPEERVKERLEKLKGNYSITDIVEEKNEDIIDDRKEDDDMGRSPKTLNEILGIGTIMTMEQFNQEFKKFSDDLKVLYYRAYGDNLDQPTMIVAGTDYYRVNHNNQKLRDKYKALNGVGVTEQTQQRPKGAYKAGVISAADSKPEDFFQTIPDNSFKISFYSFSQSDQKKLENHYGLEKLKNEFPKGETMSLNNVFKYLKERLQNIENKKELEELSKTNAPVVKASNGDLKTSPVKKQPTGTGIVPPQPAIKVFGGESNITPMKEQLTGTGIVPQQPAAQPKMDSATREKYNSLLNGEEFAKTLEALQKSPLAREMCLARPTQEALVIKLLLGFDTEFPLTSFEEIAKIIRVDEEQIISIVHSFFRDLSLRLTACEDMIMDRHGLKIQKNQS